MNQPLMIQQLLDHIEKLTVLPSGSASIIESSFERRTYKRKEFLLTEGQRCFEKFFIVKGCVQLCYLKQNGTQQTTDFAIESWWISDFMAFANSGVARFSIRAIEDTQVLSISAEDQRQLLKKVPELEAYFHIIFQKSYAAAQMRLRYLYEFSKEDLYLNFLKDFPAFTQRVPQYLLASFLGFSPEYLSELRKKFFS
jgi:CRP-like cAMP-binding protein